MSYSCILLVSYNMAMAICYVPNGQITLWIFLSDIGYKVLVTAFLMTDIREKDFELRIFIMSHFNLEWHRYLSGQTIVFFQV